MAKRQPAPAPSEPAPQTGEYTVVARRYRPQQFADLVGQGPVARALTNAIKGDRVAHAYLFTGARGVGKTSTARILAKALNCEKGPSPTPCDQCSSCQSIATGEDIDVLEIDGASNRGIDEVRAIRQNVNTRPSRSRYKIYIIDEVHMLTGQAFNALLKTLEEPPAHVKFIFATTEVQKIPVTILSRCQRFDFTGISSSRISERLKQVVEAEGMQADEVALQLVARRAGGSMRDAQSLLDQLLAFGGERLTVEQVNQLLGTAADERMLALAGVILSRDSRGAIRIVSECAEEGLQLGEVLDQLIDYWRSLMLIQSAGADSTELHLSEVQRQTMLSQAQSMSLDTILAGLDILSTTKSRMRATSHPQILLEMAVIRLSRLDELIPLVQLTQLLTQTAPSLPKTAPPVVAKAEPAKKNLTANPPPIANGTGVAQKSLPDSRPSATEPRSFPEIWKKAVQEVGGILASHLEKAGMPAIIGPKSLVIRFPTRYSAAYDYCVDPNSTSRIEESLRSVEPGKWVVRVEREVVSKGASLAEPPTVVSRKDREKELLQMPLFRKILDGLQGRLLTLDDDFGTVPNKSDDEPDTNASDTEEE
jgi:DNA polymerase III subunit gamma/tau